MPVYPIEDFNFRALVNFTGVQEAVLRQASLVAQREAQLNAEAFRDTGALIRSIQATVTETSATIGVPPGQPTAAYALVKELGRRPGATAPPPQALYGWMRRHGIDVRYAWIVAQHIRTRGIAGRFYMQRAYESVQQQMPQIVAAAMRQFGYY
jgi:hypothetical protein